MVALIRKLCYLIVTVLILVLTAAVLLCVGLNSPRFYERVAPVIVHFWKPGMELRGIAVQTASLRWPGRLELGGVELAWRNRAGRHHAVIDRLEINRLSEYIRRSKDLAVSVMMRAYRSDDVTCRNTLVDMNLRRAVSGGHEIDAAGILGELTAGGYVWEGMHFDVSGVVPVYEIRIKQGKFYGGQFRADIHYEAVGRGPYTGTVVLDKVPTRDLSTVFHDLERDVEGVISGDIYIVGDSHSMQNLEMNLTTRQDIRIRATLIGWVIMNGQLADKNAVFRMINDEIRRNEKMQYYAFDMSLQNDGQNFIRIKMNMKTRKHTFVLNPNIEIHSDGDLMTTVRRLEAGLRHGALENFNVTN